jgi:hypothetical protein
LDEDSSEKSDQAAPIARLWRRAPAFRRITYLAGAASIAGVLALAFNQTDTVQPSVSTPVAATPAQVAPPSVSATASLPAPTPVSQKTDPGVTAQTGSTAPAVPAHQPAAIAANDEDSQLARCHPHLLPGGGAMPQIDVSQMADPGIGHLKVHFWVNGAGVVTRDVVTASNFALPSEQEAALAYTKTLTFSVPQTTECRLRQMELVGDYFEMKSNSGKWATFVRLYPRLSFDADGRVLSRD